MTASAPSGPSPSGGGPVPYNDGYGNTPTIDEALADYEAWLHRRAGQMLPPTDHRHDDLVQEGRIAMWQAHNQHDPAKGALPAWLTQNATWHMREVLARRGKWTGSPSRRQGRHAVQDLPTESLNELLDPESRHRDETAGGVAPDIAEQAMGAYHQAEIAAALAGLTEKQRRYVLHRFWGDAAGPELKAEFGYDPKALWSRTGRRAARDQLADSLAHLNAA
ncbi:RNA polymerase sigma factor [Streptomyces sp. NBC_01422]|uniref:RNA polymerase sigma factor n=1 Tax=Streptomyces sp. NBC_01422 TaxID=2903859 RepID=UPI002E2A0AA9|nr:sigma-70 family RNA polymerase sigma factor [Streptomyces sp. NBC_01422]